MTTDAARDTAALAEANLTPVLGRYFQRSWSHGERSPPVRHGRPCVPRLRQRDRGHGARPRRIPRVTAADPRPGRPADRADQRDRLHRAHLAARGGTGRDVPGPARLGDVPELRLRGDRRRAQAGPSGHRATGDHRVPGRVPRPDVRGDERHELEHQLPGRLRAAPAGRPLRAVPDRLPGLRRRRGGRLGVGPGELRTLFATVVAPSAVGVDPDRAGPRRGRLRPGAGVVPARPPRDLRRARHPAHRRRGPVGLRPDRRDVGVRARRDRPRRRDRGQGHRQRPAPLGDRLEQAPSRSAGDGAPTARRTAGTRSRARPVWRSWARSATRACSPTPQPAARSCGAV